MLSEIITNIRTIKCFTWETQFNERVNVTRDLELKVKSASVLQLLLFSSTRR